MSSFRIIQDKLEEFIRKYYTNELIRGGILFFAIGLLYLILVLLVEYFLWLDTGGRTVLFWTFVLVEAGLFARFIALPLAKLFNLQRGLDHETASKIIGSHFPEVSDKLLNVIQLNQNRRESELLAASIDQKASELQPIPFKRAINFKKNVKYLKYAAAPVLIIICISWLWDRDWFSTSFERVANYDTAYEPPAPFSFNLITDRLEAIEGQSFKLQVRTEGTAIPPNASIVFGTETYVLKQPSPGTFEYTFVQPKLGVDFHFEANGVTSADYRLEVLETPSLERFQMELDYPGYTGKRDETLSSSGNTVVPEGTKVRWIIDTRNTDRVALKTTDSVQLFEGGPSSYELQRQLFRKLDYTLTTSNQNLEDHENLSYTIGVIRDAYPEIRLDARTDSLDPGRMFFLGQISDDYGLSKLQLVYYQVSDPEALEKQSIPINRGNFDQFLYSFPDGQQLQSGQGYEYYFEVFDNDGIRGGKSVRSAVYNYRKLTEEEVEQEQLKNQEERIEDLNNSLDQIKDQERRLEKLSNTNKQKEELNWNDKKELEEFIKRQEQQDQMMKNFSKEMREELDQFQQDQEEPDPYKEQLEDRLEEQEQKLEENEELLKELERLQDKIDKEELSKKLEEMAKQQKNQQKNLEQLVELTKRYYVTKKAEQLAEKLFELGQEQEQLSESPQDENTLEKQEELNKKFEEYQKEMEGLKKENQDLKQPMDIGQDPEGEQEVKEEQQNATQKLEQGNPQQASPSQKKAGQKMKQMGEQMQMQMQAGQSSGMEEDVKMLRQILDNLVVFSFEQEDLMGAFKETDYGSATFGKKLNLQNDLKLNFEHIDDSIFALSLRQPMIGGKINESITTVSFSIDKALERLAENQFRGGIASQQYAVTGANELANLLGDLLNNMQNMMMMPMPSQGQGEGQGQGQGQGQGRGFQLPDIIQQQESLGQQMQEGLQQQQGEGQQPGEGEGQEGQGEGQGESGDGGEGGDGGSGNKDGENGRDGKEGYSEEMNGKLFEIYKKQQDLKNQLEDRLSREGLKGDGGKLIKEMEGIQQQLLEKGFNQNTLERMLNLQYELMKLDEADFKQGMESRRESKTNRKTYQNTSGMTDEEIKKYFNTNEILNREALPLQRPYKKAVKEYFEKQND